MTFTSKKRNQSSSGICSKGLGSKIPRLLIRISISGIVVPLHERHRRSQDPPPEPLIWPADGRFESIEVLSEPDLASARLRSPAHPRAPAFPRSHIQSPRLIP